MAAYADMMIRLRANAADLQTGLDTARNELKKTKQASKDTQASLKALGDGAGNIANKMVPGFGVFTQLIGRLSPVFKAATVATKGFGKALVATGIGAIVVAIGLLISNVEKMEGLMNKVREVLKGVAEVVRTLVDRLKAVGKIFAGLVSLNWGKVAEGWKDANDSFNKSLKDTYEETAKLERNVKRISQAVRTLAMFQADWNKEVAEQQEILADDESTLDEKYAALKKIRQIQEQSYFAEKNVLEEQQKQYELENKRKQNTEAYKDAMTDFYVKLQDNEAKYSNQKTRNEKTEKRLNREKAAAEKTAADEQMAAIEAKRKATEEAHKEQMKMIEERTKKELEFQLTLENIAKKGPQMQALKYDTSQLADIETPKLDTPQMSLSDTAFANYVDGVSSMGEMMADQWRYSIQDMARTSVDFGKILTGGLTDAVFQLGDAFGGLLAGDEGAGFASMVDTVLGSARQLVNGMLMTALAKYIENAMSSNPENIATGGLWGLGAAAVGVGVLTALWQKSVKPFAAGGLAYGPTLGLVGEYAGASSNPEVIAPLDKLQKMLYNPVQNLEIQGVVRGKDLELMLRRI